MHKSKERLAHRIKRCGAKAVQKLTCPACGGGLSIGFVPAGPGGKGAGSLFVTCFTCMWRIISDGVPSEPPWVSELGCKIETGPNKVSLQSTR